MRGVFSVVQSERNTRNRQWRAWVFPFAVWLAGSYFLLGKLGKWSDDYSMMCASKVTGEWTFAGVSKYMWTGMWRPINLQTAGYLQSVLWTQDRAIHTITAVLHALVAWMLFRFLRRAGISAHAAAGGAVLFLGAPMAYEVIFWAPTIGALIGAITALGLGMLVMRLGDGRMRWGVFAPVGFVLALLIACAYEQPATACGAMPLLYLGASDPARGWRKRFMGACGVALVLGLGCLAYVAGVVGTVSAGARGSAQTFVSSETIGMQTVNMLYGLSRRLFLERFAAGAWQEGLWRIAQTPVWTGVVALLLAVGAVMWVRWWMRGDYAPKTTAETQTTRGVGRWWMILFAVAGFLLAFLPILAIRGQGVESRLLYWPLICLTIVAAVCTDWVIVCAARWKGGWAVRAVAGAAVAGGAVVGCVLLVGVQSAYAKRSRMDIRAIADMRAQLPDPAPGTVFVSVAHRDRAVQTGSAYFDTFMWGIWQIPWAALPAVQLGYQREDLWAISNAPWTSGMDVDSVTEHGVLTRPGRWAWGKAPDAQGRQMIGWERIVPVRLDADGRPTIASTVVLELPDGRDLVKRLPQADKLVPTGEKELRVRMGCDVAPPAQGAAVSRIEPVSGWRWVLSGGKDDFPVEMARHFCWEVTHRGVRMTPDRGQGGAGAARSRMATEVRGSTAEIRRVLHLRVTSVPGVLKKKNIKPAPDGTMLEIFINGADKPATSVLVDARALERERRWMDVACELPRIDATKGDGMVRIEVRVSRKEGMWPADVWVTSGAVVAE